MCVPRLTYRGQRTAFQDRFFSFQRVGSEDQTLDLAASGYTQPSLRPLAEIFLIIFFSDHLLTSLFPL